MKATVSNSQKKTIFQILEKAGYASAFGPGYNEKKIKLHYYLNRDGSIRWLWLADATQPNFLRFYNASGWKAKIFVILCQFAFFFRLGKLMKHGSLEMPVSEKGFEKIHPQMAIFTGTPGPNRKAVIFQPAGTLEGEFIKIPMGIYAKLQIDNEIKALQEIQKLDLQQVIIPNLTKNGVQNIRTHQSERANHLLPPHFAALNEIYQQTYICKPLRESAMWHKTGFYLNQVTHINKFSKSFLNNLQKLYAAFDTTETYSFALAHKDFTPWNLFIADNTLQAYDWEMASFDTPVLFDAFHFIFQQGILVERKSFKQIHQQINNLHNHPVVSRWVPERKSFQKYYHLYLLQNISYYLLIYKQQEVWHEQINWLLEVWAEAIQEALFHYQDIPMRVIFTERLFEFLEGKRYAALKLLEEDVKNLPVSSDLDMCIKATELDKVLHFIENNNLVGKVKTIKRSFMSTTEIYFKDGSYLSIDWIVQFKRRATEMMSATELLSWAVPNEKGIMIPTRIHDLIYCIFFYILNGSSVPSKYHTFFGDLKESEQNDLIDFIRYISEDKTVSQENWHTYSKSRKIGIEKYLNNQYVNKSLKGLKNHINYLADTFKNKFLKKGLVITFSGVDGAGKSTVISNIKQAFESTYRKKVVVLRHRPSLLPILSAWQYGKQEAEQRSINSLPRQGKNKNILSSLFRFGYYLTDYVLGQFYVNIKYVNQGYIVIYDRYYFDMIEDAKRSNIHLPARFTSWFYKMLLKPDVNFFLYAPAETIIFRKKELDKQAIEELTHNYLSLFEKFENQYKKSRYIPVQNNVLTDTMDTIIQKVQELS
jgi:thymidylate kinase